MEEHNQSQDMSQESSLLKENANETEHISEGMDVETRDGQTTKELQDCKAEVLNSMEICSEVSEGTLDLKEDGCLQQELTSNPSPLLDQSSAAIFNTDDSQIHQHHSGGILSQFTEVIQEQQVIAQEELPSVPFGSSVCDSHLNLQDIRDKNEPLIESVNKQQENVQYGDSASTHSQLDTQMEEQIPEKGIGESHTKRQNAIKGLQKTQAQYLEVSKEGSENVNGISDQTLTDHFAASQPLEEEQNTQFGDHGPQPQHKKEEKLDVGEELESVECKTIEQLKRKQDNDLGAEKANSEISNEQLKLKQNYEFGAGVANPLVIKEQTEIKENYDLSAGNANSQVSNDQMKMKQIDELSDESPVDNEKMKRKQIDDLIAGNRNSQDNTCNEQLKRKLNDDLGDGNANSQVDNEQMKRKRNDLGDGKAKPQYNIEQMKMKQNDNLCGGKANPQVNNEQIKRKENDDLGAGNANPQVNDIKVNNNLDNKTQGKQNQQQQQTKKQKSCVVSENYERINYLVQTSRSLVNMSGHDGESASLDFDRALASQAGSLAMAVGRRCLIRMAPSLKRMLCKGCGTALVYGVNARVRHRSNRQKHLVITCLTCHTVKRLVNDPKHKLWSEQEEAML